MSEIVSIQKQVYDKKEYPKVIDINFNQLVKPKIEEEVIELTVDEFFNQYQNLFFQIPKFGDVNSHSYIIKKSSEYIGLEQNSDDISALLEEINSLRSQLLEANQTILELSTNVNGESFSK